LDELLAVIDVEDIVGYVSDYEIADYHLAGMGERLQIKSTVCK
jgi:hypothetical protein